MLPKAVHSVALQTEENDEIVIVNDDVDASVCLDKIHPKLVVLNNLGRHGAAAARNLGVKNAKNDYIVFLDDDDLMVNGYLTILRQFIKKNSDASWGRCEIIYYHEESTSINIFQKNHGQLRWEKISSPIEKLFGAGCGFWVKRSIFLEVGQFDESLSNSEDIDLCCRLEQRSKAVYKLLHPGVLVRRNHTDGIENLTTRTNNLEKLQCWFSVYKRNRSSRPIFNRIRIALLERCIRRGVNLNLARYTLSRLIQEKQDPLVIIFLPIFFLKSLKKKLIQRIF